MQNAPIFSHNITNETSSFVFDSGNLRTLSLVYKDDGDSFICSNGVGETACPDSADREDTIYRENDHGE